MPGAGEPSAPHRRPSACWNPCNLYTVSSPRPAHMMKFISADNWDFSRAVVRAGLMRCSVPGAAGMCAGPDGAADEWLLWQIHNLGFGAAARETNS